MAHDCVWLGSVMMCRAISLQISFIYEMVERLLAYLEGLCSVEALMHVDWIHMAHDCVWLGSVMMCRAINLQVSFIYEMVERLLAYQEGLCSVKGLMHVDWIRMAHDSVWLWSVMMCRAISLKILSICEMVRPQDANQYRAETHLDCAQAVKPIWQSSAVHIIGLAVLTVRPTASSALTI